jgi:hypothetical protein
MFVERSLEKVLRHHLPSRREQNAVAELPQRLLDQGGLVGRVEKDEVEPLGRRLQGWQGLQYVRPSHPGVLLQGAEAEIFLDQPAGGVVPFHPHHGVRAAAESLKADGAGAGKQVKHHGAFDATAEDIEQRFAHPVRCRAQCRCL